MAMLNHVIFEASKDANLSGDWIMPESLRILILEDNPTDAELVHLELQEAGTIFTSKVVMTGKDYVHELQECFPDLTLSDYDPPVYNGPLALAKPKRRCPDTPFTWSPELSVKNGQSGEVDKRATSYFSLPREQNSYPGRIIKSQKWRSQAIQG